MRIVTPLTSLVFCALFAAAALAQDAPPPDRPPRAERPDPPTLTVHGEAQASARPDRAVVRVGAVVQDEGAGPAQEQVNQIMQRAIADLKDAVQIPEEAIRTAGVTLTPVHSNEVVIVREGRPAPQEPRIVGYRASNSVIVRVDDLEKIGRVIDAAVAAGANQVEGVHFELRDDTAQRTEALREAARRARQKAEAMAEAMGVRLGMVRRVIEGHVGIMPPQPMYAGRMMMAEAAMGTAVEPGQIEVHASVTVEYTIRPEDGGGAAGR